MSLLSKKLIAVVVVVFVFTLVYSVVVKHKTTYTSVPKLVEQFEKGSAQEGDIVVSIVKKIDRDNPLFGDVLYISEDVILVGQTRRDINEGDEVKAKIKTAEKRFDIWYVTYE